MSAPPPSQAEIERAVQAVREHAQAPRLGTFAFEVLASQAEGQATFAGQRFMQQLAREHAVDLEVAATREGNLLGIVERGPGSSLEVALVGAFATTGFAALCRVATPEQKRELAEKLVGYMGWLEMATPYRITPFLGRLLPSETRALVEDALLAGILRDDSESADVDTAVRARNAARITTLARTQGDAARSSLRLVRDRAKDPATRAVASALLGDLASWADHATPLRVEGVARAPSRRLSAAIARWLTGFALVMYGVRVICYLIALRNEAEIELDGGLLRVRGRTRLLGKIVRSNEAYYTLDRISGAFRRARFALLRSAVGVISLSLGVLLGAHLLFDGARGGAPLLLLIGAAVVLVGSALDLALEIWWPARAGQVELQVDVEGARSVRLSRVPLDDADRLLTALAERVPARA